MKQIFTSPESAEMGLLQNMLCKVGIPCVELNGQLARMIPGAPFQAELWVENEADYPAAVAFLEAWHHPTIAEGTDWTCSRCGERLGYQFSKCWKCGTKRNALA